MNERLRRTAPWLLLPVTIGGGLLLVLLVADRLALPPRPDPVSELGELPASSLQVPVEVDFTGPLETLEREIPVRFGDLAERRGSPADPNLRYAFEAERSPFEAELRGDRVHLTTVIRYRGRIWYSTPFGGDLTAGCGLGGNGDEAPRAVVHLSSPLAIGEDWTLRTNVEVERLEPLTDEDRCRVSVFQLQMDATDPILTAAHAWLQGEADGIGAALEALPLRDHLADYWELVQEPVSLGNDLWLTLDPRTVRHGELSAGGPGGRTLHTDVGMEVHPRIVMGHRPRARGRPLPPLGGGAADGSRSLVVEGRVEYPSLSRGLEEALRSRDFLVAGRSVRIRDVEVGGAGDGRVTVRLEVEGGLRGRLLLEGTPVYDPDRNGVAVPDLDLSVEEGSILVRTGGWVLGSVFPGVLRRRASWSVDRELAAAATLLPEHLVYPLGEGARLEGRLGPAEITDVAATREALVVRSLVEARMRLIVGGL